jgi:hypothetical protein
MGVSASTAEAVTPSISASSITWFPITIWPSVRRRRCRLADDRRSHAANRICRQYNDDRPTAHRPRDHLRSIRCAARSRRGWIVAVSGGVGVVCPVSVGIGVAVSVGVGVAVSVGVGVAVSVGVGVAVVGVGVAWAGSCLTASAWPCLSASVVLAASILSVSVTGSDSTPFAFTALTVMLWAPGGSSLTGSKTELVVPRINPTRSDVHTYCYDRRTVARPGACLEADIGLPRRRR